jgi:hypothetical protein
MSSGIFQSDGGFSGSKPCFAMRHAMRQGSEYPATVAEVLCEDCPGPRSEIWHAMKPSTCIMAGYIFNIIYYDIYIYLYLYIYIS